MIHIIYDIYDIRICMRYMMCIKRTKRDPPKTASAASGAAVAPPLSATIFMCFMVHTEKRSQWVPGAFLACLGPLLC